MKIKSFILLFWMVLATFTNSNSQTCSDCRFITPVFDSVTVSTVKFGEGKNVDGNNQELYMDIYQPFGDTMTNRPVAIFAFGGAFVQGLTRLSLRHRLF
jgi:para-nitrobenzyl esterase